MSEAQGSLLPGRRTRTSLGRAVRAAYRGTTGDENVAAELNTLYTHAVGRNTLTLGLSPALALGLSPSPADVVIARPTWL